MEKFLEEIIKRIYVEKDYDFFISQCHKEIEFINELKTITSKITTNITDPVLKYGPCIELTYIYDSFEKGEFKISYWSVLNISKIIPVFSIHHEFEVDNIDENSLCETCDCSPQPYNKHQDTLHKMVSSFLINKGYKELSYNEIEEVIPYLKMPEGRTLLGPQITVEIALFNDMYDINPDEDE